MTATRSELDALVVKVFRDTGTVLDWEGLLYGYLPNHNEDAVRRSLRNAVRRGDLIRCPGGGRRGFYIHPSSELNAAEPPKETRQ